VRAATLLGAEPLHHLVQRDVLALPDQPDDEGFMRIEAGGAAAALRAWPQFTDLRPRNPADRTGHSHAAACRADMPSSEAFKTRNEDPRSTLLPSSTSIEGDVESAQNAAVTIDYRSQDVL
jgi:hypothetical protein